ncbi:MAG: hypothetical protein H7330_08965 [Hymenobacteraceae bacterium]|nr:hypothetical protein [Hymenobacteraceae bacterium]
MMLPRLVLLSTSLLTFFLLGACHRQAVSAAAITPPRVLQFGTGGGFVGTSTRYLLYATGRLERQQGAPGDSTVPAVVLTSLAPAAVARYFRAFDALPTDSLTLQQPGNMYYFLAGRTATGRPVALTWGANGARISRAAQNLFDELMKLPVN